MSWDELETRARQEVSKRVDLIYYGLGMRRAQETLQTPSGPSPVFFFSGDELPTIVRLLQTHLSHETQNIVAEADEICRHRFRLLGYPSLDYGAEIDWHLDAVHGLRSPLIPWFKINFLDFSEVGDHKVTWELSRHQHLVTLAKAWLLTRKEVYLREIVAQWYSWQRANPYPLGLNWASSLEIAFRSLAWIWVHHMVAPSRCLPGGFLADLQRALAFNARVIERYLSTYFSPNTHLLGEAVALFFIGTLYPGIPSSENLRNNSWKIIEEQAFRQVRADGIYFEQSLYYHVYALDFFLHARLLAARNGRRIPAEFDAVLKKMLVVVQALFRNGSIDSFGDDDGGRVFNPRRNRAEHLTDPLAIGSALFKNEMFSAGCALTEEAIWLLGEQALACLDRTAAEDSSSSSQSFADGGIYIVDGAEPLSEQLVIDAGPQGTGRSGHGHADALSLKLAFSGRSWLVDAGTYCYIGQDDDRDRFRGTPAHNTLTVDGLDQAEPEGPFAWNSLPRTKAELWITGPSFTLFAGSHSGYERLPEPVRHRRFLFHLHGNFSLVRDIAEGSGSHLLETSWHFAPDLKVSLCGSSFVISAAPEQNPDAAPQERLMLLPTTDPRWRSRLFSEYASPAYGIKLSAPVVRCSARVALPAEHAVLLIPGRGGDEGAVEFSRDEHMEGNSDPPEAVYRYRRGDTSHVLIFRRAQQSEWNFGPWRSDAKFLYFCTQGRRVTHVVFSEVSSAHFEGQPLISHPTNLQWLQWRHAQGGPQLACSDKTFSGFSGPSLEQEIAP